MREGGTLALRLRALRCWLGRIAGALRSSALERRTRNSYFKLSKIPKPNKQLHVALRSESSSQDSRRAALSAVTSGGEALRVQRGGSRGARSEFGGSAGAADAVDSGQALRPREPCGALRRGVFNRCSATRMVCCCPVTFPLRYCSRLPLIAIGRARSAAPKTVRSTARAIVFWYVRQRNSSYILQGISRRR